MVPKLVKILFCLVVIRDSIGSYQHRIHYSVLEDTRAMSWASSAPSSFSEGSGIVKLRAPILNITVIADLSDPRDIDLLQALFFGPLPAEIVVRPWVDTSTRASGVLAKCFDTIAFDTKGALDSVRVRDFINSLFLLAELSADSPLDGNAGKRISNKAAALVCKLYTQQFSTISDWIDSVDPASVGPGSDSLPVRSISINGRILPHTVPISTVLQSLVDIQYETIRSTKHVYDEL